MCMLAIIIACRCCVLSANLETALYNIFIFGDKK